MIDEAVYPLYLWLKATGLSHFVRTSTWMWQACESIHFIGLSLLMGTVGLFDLRLMGFFRRIPVSAARDLMPFAVFGFVLNLITGIIFWVGLPEQYAHNRMWWWKVAFMAIAGVNALAFETSVAKQVVRLGEGEDTPAAAKLVGALSLFAWLAVLYCGRMLPFIGDAY